ncbi:hypothetical protein CsSME_00000933 [Camellia sinensis var. sinensis]
MSLSLHTSLLLVFLLSLLLLRGTTSLPGSIGMTYTSSSSSPPPDHVASTLQSLKISAVRLPNPSPSVVRSFSYSNISLLLSLPNSLLPSLASNRSSADLFLYTHVIPFYPRSHISSISLGSDIFSSSSDLSSLLLPALRNLHSSLISLGIHSISLSTTFSFVNIMSTAFPPSSAEFNQPISQLIIKPLLDFLDETNSSFFVNLYPYSVYSLNHDIPIGFALFQEQEPFNFREDSVTGVKYRNLFDVMVDAVISAMAVAGHENIPVVVTETGWPSSSNGAGDPDAREGYAEIYIKGLIDHLKSGLGTPLRKEGVAQTYIYELFDGDEKQGNETGEQNWGILFPNMTAKYHIDFSEASGGPVVEIAIGFVLAVVGVLILH